jgi:FixJ family two-component response regulator
MTHVEPVVSVIDDDASVRSSLENLLRSVGMSVAVFASAKEFLASPHSDAPGCLVLDVRLPGMSGLDLQEQLTRSRPDLPIVFITGHGDIPMTVRAMKAGAVEFLTKPFGDEDLIEAVQQALRRARENSSEREDMVELRGRYESLTPREREVMRHVVAGEANKVAAAELGISETTIKIHRGHIMHKMRAGSLAELVRMADRLAILRPRAGTHTTKV